MPFKKDFASVLIFLMCPCFAIEGWSSYPRARIHNRHKPKTSGGQLRQSDRSFQEVATLSLKKKRPYLYQQFSCVLGVPAQEPHLHPNKGCCRYSPIEIAPLGGRGNGGLLQQTNPKQKAYKPITMPWRLLWLHSLFLLPDPQAKPSLVCK